MKKIFYVFILFIFSSAYAQEYKPLESKGAVPEDFYKKSSEKIDDERDEFVTSQTKSEKKLEESFLIESSFGTDNLLRSGRVFFGDSVTNYVNKVAAKLLKNDPELLDELSFYTFKSPSTNAFAFNNGIVMINLGLIAQLENESQLAYILAHEISHYVNQDAIEKYIEKENINKGKGVYRQLSFSEKELAMFDYSKDIESTADEHGLEIYLESNYSLKEVEGAFDVLKYSYLPFDDIKFDASFLENEYFKIPSNYFLDDVNPIDPDEYFEEDGDDMSTHPSADDRKNDINDLIEDEDADKGSIYLVSEEEFKAVQKIARFELSRLFLIYSAYEESIYNSYLLLEYYPDNFYLQKNIAKSLHMITTHFNENERMYSRIIDVEEDLQGESQQLYFMVESFRKDDEVGFNSMAMAYTYSLYRENPDDAELKALFEDLVHEMVYEHEVEFSDLKKKPKEEEPESEEVQVEEVQVEEESEDEEDDEINNSKYDKIKKKEKEEAGDYYEYAFIDYLKEDLFKDAFDFEEQMLEDEEAEDERWDNLSKKDKKLEIKEEAKNYEGLGIEKIVVVDPFYAKIGANKSGKYKYFKSELGQENYANQLGEIADSKSIGIDIEVLDQRAIDESEVNIVQDIAVLKDWFAEQSNLDSDVTYSNIDQDLIDNLVATHGTKYFMWSGAISLKERNRRGIGMMALWGIYFPPSLIFTIPNRISKSHYLVHFNVLFDVETGEIVYTDYAEVNYKGNNSLLKPKIYSTLDKISQL